MADSKVIVEINADDKASDKLKGLGSKFKSFGDTVKENWLSIAAVTASVIMVYNKVAGAIKEVIDAAAEAELIWTKLRIAVENSGASWSSTETRIREFTSSMQKMTKFGDEETAKLLQDLVPYTNDVDKAMRGAKIAMDMAAAGLFDINTASKYIGMAMQGNVEMLGRYVGELRSSTNTQLQNMSAAEKTEYALNLLQQKYGGMAEGELNTFTNKTKQLTNYTGDLKEALGDLIVSGDAWQTEIDSSITLVENLTLRLQLLKQEQELSKDVTDGSTEAWKNFLTMAINPILGPMQIFADNIIPGLIDSMEQQNEKMREQVNINQEVIDKKKEEGDVAVNTNEIIVTAYQERLDKILSGEQTQIDNLKTLWQAYNTEKEADTLARNQKEMEKYTFMIDVQRKANTTLWTEAGKQRDVFSKGISQMTMDWIKGDLDIKKSIEGIGESMLKMLLDWAVQTAVNQALSMVFKSAEIAAATATGAAVAAAWAPAAALASLASFGSNAAPAAAAIVSTNALAMAMAIPKAEKGGIVQGSPEGTLVVVGEKNKREAIIPLDSSPGISMGGRGDMYFNFTINNPTGKIDPELMQLIVEEVSYAVNRDSER